MDRWLNPWIIRQLEARNQTTTTMIYGISSIWKNSSTCPLVAASVRGLTNALLNRWEYLTEKFAYERRVREHKLKTALMQVSLWDVNIANNCVISYCTGEEKQCGNGWAYWKDQNSPSHTSKEAKSRPRKWATGKECVVKKLKPFLTTVAKVEASDARDSEMSTFKRRFRQRDMFQTDGTDKKAPSELLQKILRHGN